MLVNRVILVSNNNPTYYQFWNNLSYTYKVKFGIEPTLVFFGQQNEITSLGLSEKYGKIIVQEKVNDVMDWQYTWALFYFTKFFPNDVCAVMGIDQIPMGTFFLKDCLENIQDDKYVMFIDDQYKLENKHPKKWDEGGFSPSAYHISKGTTFEEIFCFEKTFEEEIKKINGMNVPTMWGNKWGTDESYACLKLRTFKDRDRIKDLSKSADFLKRRIDCHRSIEVQYDLNLLKSNYYIECHSCRPYSKHKNYIDELFNNIPKFV